MPTVGDADAGLLKLMRSLPGFAGYEFNPQILVKVINHLRALGKDGALTVLGEYDSLSMNDRSFNPENVWLIARSLLVPAQGQGALPELHLGGTELEESGTVPLPLFPLHVYEGMPFLLINGYLAGGEARPAAEYLEWARRAGEVRPEPLIPSDNPLDSVDRFLESSTWKSLNLPEGRSWMLRSQALRSISSVLPIAEHDVSSLTVADTADRVWKNYRERVAGMTICWNPSKNDYDTRSNP